MSHTGPIRAVLVATDPFEEAQSRALCDAATEVGDLHGAELHFLYALPPVRFPSAATEGIAQRETLSQAARRLDELIDRARRRGVTARWSAREGSVDDAIRAEARDRGADLVVVSSPRRWFPGRWVRKLRRKAGVPVLCLPRSEGSRPDLAEASRILVPTFRRTGALRSVAAALRVFSPPSSKAAHGSRVLLVGSRTRNPTPGGSDTPAAPSLAAALDANAEERELARIASDLRELGIETDVALRGDDDPVEAVAQQARDASADVVALDARSQDRSRFRGWLRRSFLGRVLRRLSRPLLVP